MCRNIRPLYNYEPPVTQAEIREAALQYVRKVSGFHQPSKANEAAFEAAVEAVTATTGALLDALETKAPPRNRAVEIARARERYRAGPVTGEPPARPRLNGVEPAGKLSRKKY